MMVCKSQEPRLCYECATTKTYLQQKNGKTKLGVYQLWHFRGGNIYCHRCYMRLFIAQNNNPRRIRFKGERIYLKKNPRTGKCTRCKRTIASGEITGTDMHHDKYDRKHPAKFTREMCDQCHLIITNTDKNNDAWRE